MSLRWLALGVVSPLEEASHEPAWPACWMSVVEDADQPRTEGDRGSQLRMQSALGENAPAGISDALDTLLKGDLSPEQYTMAAQALAEACG